METLTLNDGTVLNGHALESDGVLWVYLDEGTLTNSFPILNDPDKTIRIHEDRYGELTDYVGYRHLFCIREEDGGMLSAGLRKR